MKKLSYNKRIILILLIIWLIITVNLIKSTYAKYVTQFDANSNFYISHWNIKLNNHNILSEEEMENVLSLLFPGNDYMESNVIVPGAVGYFDININSSLTTVPFDVIISASIDETGDAYTDKFSISGYSINNFSEITELTAGSSTFSYNIASDVASTSIRIYIEWDNLEFADEALTAASDAEDTTLGIAAQTALINVNLKFVQSDGPVSIPDIDNT